MNKIKKISFKTATISSEEPVKNALLKLNTQDNFSRQILFVNDENNKIIGSLTDGDIRRSLIAGKTIDIPVKEICNYNFDYILGPIDNNYLTFEKFKNKKLKVIPIINEKSELLDIIDIENTFASLPVSAVIMAGGRGKRLSPLTDNIPKPLLKVAGLALIEHVILHLKKFNITNIYISVNYLSDQIIEKLGDGSKYSVDITYLKENTPLGTAGSLSLIKNYKTKDLVIINSDLLTNIDFSKMYYEHVSKKNSLTIASRNYSIDIPFAVFEKNGDKIISSVEKPKYTYETNAGIYILSSETAKVIPNEYFDMTDLIDEVIKQKKNITSYQMQGYWIDIGRPEDFDKANSFFKK